MTDNQIKALVLKEFCRIPGVGKSIANDLWQLGFRSLLDLRNQDPELMYDKLCQMVGYKVDRCMLYVFRCAVYYVDNQHHEPEKLKWWNWKDKMITF